MQYCECDHCRRTGARVELKSHRPTTVHPTSATGQEPEPPDENEDMRVLLDRAEAEIGTLLEIIADLRHTLASL